MSVVDGPRQGRRMLLSGSNTSSTRLSSIPAKKYNFFLDETPVSTRLDSHVSSRQRVPMSSLCYSAELQRYADQIIIDPVQIAFRCILRADHLVG